MAATSPIAMKVYGRVSVLGLGLFPFHLYTLPGTQMVLPSNKMGSTKGSPMWTAGEPFQVLDGAFFV